MFVHCTVALCTTVAHNTTQNRPDNFPSYTPDNHHCSDDVYLREGARSTTCVKKFHIPVISVLHKLLERYKYEQQIAGKQMKFPSWHMQISFL